MRLGLFDVKRLGNSIHSDLYLYFCVFVSLVIFCTVLSNLDNLLTYIFDRSLKGKTTSPQSGPESNGNEWKPTLSGASEL